MKQLIVPIAIIVALIAFFVVVDCKESGRHDDVQMVQGESPTTNRKPMVSVPETESATEVKPAVETKLIEAKPVVETKPVTEPPPVTEIKPVETTPVVEVKSDVKPAAVPVATEEEAIRTNEEALKLLSKKETISPSKDINNVAETITENKPLPMAIPVLTPEEAIKANEEALKLLSKKETISPSKDTNNVAETITEEKLVPMAIPVLTPEEAIKANKEAIRTMRNKAIAEAFQSFIHKIGLNNNRIHFILSLLPLLFVFDVLLLKGKKEKRSSKVFGYISLPRRIRILFSVSLLAFGILVFVPWSVYFGNSLQFPFIFQDFVNWNLRLLTISIVGASIILLLIPPIISDYLVAMIAGLGLCVYVQSMFMNQYLGTMDGSEPAWSEHRVFGTINLIIWIALIVFPVIFRKVAPHLFFKVIPSATGAVLFLEVLATASMVLSASQDVWGRKETYVINGTKQFQLSKEKNIVLILMDALGSGWVEKCFEDYPETKEIVKDFTWYREARSNYIHTFPGLICEMTGSLLTVPANNYKDMFDKMWHTSSARSFYKQIDNAGYDARFYMSVTEDKIGAPDLFQEFFSNVECKSIIYVIDYKRILFCLKQMSGFSSVPFFFKHFYSYSFDFSNNSVEKKVYDDPSEDFIIPYSNSHFLEKMLSSGISLDANKPILSFHYIVGTHLPWIYGEKGNRVKEPFDNPIPSTRGCFYILSEFIRLLKEAGIYNNTAILLCSDHGGSSPILTTPCDMTVMIKPFHENKTELSIDEAKVQSLDILPTLLYMGCGEKADYKDFDGCPSLRAPYDRIRKVYRLGRDESYPNFDGWGGNGRNMYNCLEEYNFVDIKSFSWGTKSQSFVRLIPLITNKKEDE